MSTELAAPAPPDLDFWVRLSREWRHRRQYRRRVVALGLDVPKEPSR